MTQSTHQTIINDLLQHGNYSDYDPEEIIEFLQIADDEYTNDGEITSFELEDSHYDIIKLNTKRMDPANVYFTGVGSAVRGGKVDLPNAMPSLNQVEVGELSKWIRDNNLTESDDLVITDKMDGTSLQLIYDKTGQLQIAYSRGNGLQGADVTRHIRNIKKVPKQVKEGPLEIRCEVELSNTAFKELQFSMKSKSGKRYKNPRNMVAGQMNCSESTSAFYEAVDVFAYEILKTSIDKNKSLELLSSYGFTVVHNETINVTSNLTDEYLSEFLNNRRSELDYDIDGIVITINSIEKSNKLDFGITGKANPKSSIKYKVADVDNYHIATVAGVTYNISKHGFRKPQINFEPFDLQGITISNCTGFNAGFIRDNNIGKGTKLLMTRSGDVIPYVVSVNESTIADLPTDEYPDHWTETNIDLVLDNPDSHPEVRIQRMIDFCFSLDFPQLREGNVRKLFKEGYDSIPKLLHMTEGDFELVLGANGKKAHTGLINVMKNISFSDLMGSTTFFGRGLGKRKFKALLEGGNWSYHNNVPDLTELNHENIQEIAGFKQKTADKIMTGLPSFMEFYDNIKDAIQIAEVIDTSQGLFANQKICMTGFRDKYLQAAIEQAGGTVQSAASGKTNLVVAADPDGTSTKLTKARALGIKIISIDEMHEMLR